MCYYTVTLDHVSNENGHTRAIMILDAKSEINAKIQFTRSFGFEHVDDLKVQEGIHIPEGFDRLLTEQAKKYITKVKTKAEDAPPLMSYQNMIKLNYAA